MSERLHRAPGDVEGFAKVGEEIIYESWITFAKGTFRAPDGTEFARELVRHPGAVSVVPLMDDDDTVVLVRQYRPALGRFLMEIPAGKRDVAGEPVDETAQRELGEETGMGAGRLDQLCHFHNSPGFSDESHFIFLARDLTEVPPAAQSIEEHHLTVERVSLSDLPQLIAGGIIADAKTMLGLMLTQKWVETGR